MFAKHEGQWTRKVEIRTRKKFLVVGEACMAIFRPTPGFKMENICQLRDLSRVENKTLWQDTETVKPLDAETIQVGIDMKHDTEVVLQDTETTLTKE